MIAKVVLFSEKIKFFPNFSCKYEKIYIILHPLTDKVNSSGYYS